jgi:glycosyltransferase involved in cell wall biosynthesis
MKKILFVVHRYAPFPGGSENYVRDMAEETLSRGNEVAVFAGEHKGDWNGIRVTTDTSIFGENWDLIVVHGGDVPLQNFVLTNASKIPSPIMFMLIRPSESYVYQIAMRDCKYIACSTHEDWEFVHKMGYMNKSQYVPHGIVKETCVADVTKTSFRKKYGIKTKNMFLSCGGFWPNKAFHELIDAFNKAKPADTTLVLTGYDNRHGIMPPDSENVRTLMIDDHEEVYQAIAEADLYIMHSHSEGFGLVLLESMVNMTPWAARNIAGARLLKDYGFTYDNDDQLVEFMKSYEPDVGKVLDGYYFTLKNHQIKNTVDGILKVL